MRNTKKMMMTLAVALLGLGLSACGRDSYNGAYSGTQIRMPQQQQQPGQNGQQVPMPNPYMGTTTQYSGVTADLRHDGDIVTGTYDTNPQQAGTQFQTGMAGQQETYRFEATARTANRLEGVRLIPLNSMNSMMGGGCVVEGTLEAIENGRRLTGTLNPSNMGYQTNNSWMCGPLQITLDRAK